MGPSCAAGLGPSFVVHSDSCEPVMIVPSLRRHVTLWLRVAEFEQVLVQGPKPPSRHS